MGDVAWVDGWKGPLAEARIPVQDRGFLFGDGAYEVLRAYSGDIFLLRPHLDRLHQSLAGLRMKLPMTRRQLEALLLELLRDSGYEDARIYVQVTRGAGRREHVFPRDVQPTLVAWVETIRPVAANKRERGARAITLPDRRWNQCHLKALVLLPNVLAREEARRRGADEAFLVGPGNVVREGAGSNIFVWSRGRLRTHPLGPEILPGVTRACVMRLAQKAGLVVEEKRVRLPSLLAAQEVFVSSTALEILPVVRVDGQAIGSGRVGPVARDLMQRFAASTRPRNAVTH